MTVRTFLAIVGLVFGAVVAAKFVLHHTYEGGWQVGYSDPSLAPVDTLKMGTNYVPIVIKDPPKTNFVVSLETTALWNNRKETFDYNFPPYTTNAELMVTFRRQGASVGDRIRLVLIMQGKATATNHIYIVEDPGHVFDDPLLPHEIVFVPKNDYTEASMNEFVNNCWPGIVGEPKFQFRPPEKLPQ